MKEKNAKGGQVPEKKTFDKKKWRERKYSHKFKGLRTNYSLLSE